MNPADQLGGGEFVALTSPGPAAITTLRVRGPQAAVFVTRHIRTHHPPTPASWSPGRVLRAELVDDDGATVDEILLSVHAQLPAWDLRLHLHGNPWLVRRCGELFEACGLRAAESGGADLWPTVDVLEGEAWALLSQMLTLRGADWLMRQIGRLRVAVTTLLKAESLDAVRETSLRIATRFELVGWFTRPLRVVLVGPPNAGKSTLANALADRAVSVVSATPGTTRDWVEVPGEADGFPVVWLDTAGLRSGGDALEAASVARTRQVLEEADACVIVLDVAPAAAESGSAFLAVYGHLRPACVALNKIDLGGPAGRIVEALPAAWRSRAVPVSALGRSGLEALRGHLLAGAGRSDAALQGPAAFTERQVRALKETAAAVDCKAMRTKLLQVLDGRSQSDLIAAGGLPDGPEKR